MNRKDGRGNGELRPITIETGVAPYAEGSAMVSAGNTRVLCAASVEEGVPSFLKGKGKGWVTAEYAMLPRATHTRTSRERRGAGGRTMEIQRLLGRSMRAVVETANLGERTVIIDCDVIQADGGTRTMAVTGAFVAMHQAMAGLVDRGIIARNPVVDFVAAVSVGIIDGKLALDLCYEEDSQADVDMNVVMTGAGKFIELQGTAERIPFGKDDLDQLLDMASGGIREMISMQRSSLGLNESGGVNI
ncbi:MAG: ribonuclease PH [Nitrospinota bacterium]|nr:ribonuclease PH [Nitrospinota bacterium]